MDDSRASPIPADVVLSIPEIRDYRAINGALVRHLDQGCRSIRLTGAGGQRLLAARLAGPWSAVIEVVGDAGPELAAAMDAPAVSVVCRGSVADGGASGLKCGRVLVLGRTGPAFGYSQRGGMAMVVGTAGCRAGLCQLGGDLILIGRAGALAGERQLGGRLLVTADLGPHAGRGRRGGRFIQVDSPRVAERSGLADHDDRTALGTALESFGPWLTPESPPRSSP